MVEADGWYEVRVKGSHHHFKHDEKLGLVTQSLTLKKNCQSALYETS